MRAVIVYESLFGNTRMIAEAVRDGMQAAAPHARISCVPVAGATADVVQPADLLVVGGPTHMRGMTSAMSRRLGLQAERKKPASLGPELAVAGPGVQDWLRALPDTPRSRRAAAFDTRVAGRMAGGASGRIARRLRRHGYAVVARPKGFIVEDMDGPLRDGELRRAEAWGEALTAAVHTVP